MIILYQAKLIMFYGFYEWFAINPIIFLGKLDFGGKFVQVVRFRQIGGGGL